MNAIYATCSHAVKRIMWEVTIPAYDREGNPGTSHLTVCPKCYQKFYKRIAIEAKRDVIKYWGVEKTGEEWMTYFNDKILDPDGWRLRDGCNFFKTKIGYQDYVRRLAISTIKLLNSSVKRQTRMPKRIK